MKQTNICRLSGDINDEDEDVETTRLARMHATLIQHTVRIPGRAVITLDVTHYGYNHGPLDSMLQPNISRIYRAWLMMFSSMQHDTGSCV